MTSDRIEQIIKETASPESISVYQALLKVWNETRQECNTENKELKANLAHYEDNVVAEFEGEANPNHSNRDNVQITFKDCRELNIHSIMEDGKKYKVILMEM